MCPQLEKTMSEIIEHRMPYIPFTVTPNGDNMRDFSAVVSGNMLIVEEKTYLAIKAAPDVPAVMAGHMILLKDPDAPEDRFRPSMDALYPDQHGSSRVYADNIDQAIGHAATLRSLVNMTAGVRMGLVVLDFGDSDLIGQLREIGYAPKE